MTVWATAAVPGDILEIGGPRGSTIVPDDFDWVWLIGDETAIPAMSRRIDELRDDVTILATVSLLAGRAPPPMPAQPRLSVAWSIREHDADGAAAIVGTLAATPMPAGEGFVWIAAEAAATQAARDHVVGERGHDPRWIRASGYWQANDAIAHADSDPTRT